MAGYSRQSAASIVPTAVVRATPLNDEFNTLRDAFVVATGHKHDGTSTEGAYVPLISDTNSRNKVVVDSANNRISLFINVSSAAVEQLRLIDGAILPVTDNDIDLGSSSFEFKDLFIDGTANIDSLVADTAAISGGTINSAVIGGTTPAAGTFTTITATVSATIPSVAITGGTINNTIIGATTPAAGTFTNLTVNTAATIASAAISAGTINNTVIGGTTPQAITGTTITANTGFVGALTGNVTGNVTASSGTSTFNNATVNGTLSATLTGNVNASSGTSTFNNVTISGTLNMDGATAATITNLSTPVNTGDAATKGYVDTAISNLIDTAPGTLDTLNELAAALGDDPNFATTVTNSIATKLSLSGGTMTGAIAMGTNKITGLGDPTNAQDAATKTYVDTQRDTRLALSGGTMSGAIAMGTNKITGLGDPTSNQDAATKIYVDGILGSATSAAASAAAAATSASNAATSASNASTSATNAASSASASAASAAAAAASYDSFDDRYLGVKTSDPSLDNDGNALVTGAIYFNSTAGEMRVWTGSAWASTLLTTGAQTFTGVKTFASNPILDAGTANGVAYLNGSKVLTTGSALQFDGSRLGVGISPTQTIDANGAVLARSNLIAYTALVLQRSSSSLELPVAAYTNGSGNILASNTKGDIVAFGNVGGDGIIFANANLEAMRLTSTGLGIGTSSPSQKLHINVASGAVYEQISSGSNNVYLGFDNSRTVGTLQSNNALVFDVGGIYTERMRIDSSGNVGIGSTNPAAYGKLAVIGAGVTGHFDSTSGAGGISLYESGSGRGGIRTLNGSNGLAFLYGATEGMRLDSSGNLGLGVTPSAWSTSVQTALQVYTAGVSGNGGGNTASRFTHGCYLDGSTWKYQYTGVAPARYEITGPNAGSTHSWSIAAGGTAGNTISFTQAMTLDANGSLAIGGTTVVTNNGGITATTTSSGSAATTLAMRNAGTANGSGVILAFRGVTNAAAENDYAYLTMVADDTTAKTGSIRFSTGNGGSPAERARITSGGDLLVGTTSNAESARLNVQGNYAFFRENASGADVYIRGYYGNANVAAIQVVSNSPLAFATNNAERARITSAGTFQLTNNYQEGVLTANTGTAYTIDLVNGTLQILTLTGNCTFTFPTATAGQSFTMLLRQDATGGRTVTWPAAVRWPGNTAPTITSTASQTDKYIFTADGTRWYGSNAGQAYVA